MGTETFVRRTCDACGRSQAFDGAGLISPFAPLADYEKGPYEWQAVKCDVVLVGGGSFVTERVACSAACVMLALADIGKCRMESAAIVREESERRKAREGGVRCSRCGMTRAEVARAFDSYCGGSKPHPQGDAQSSQHDFPAPANARCTCLEAYFMVTPDLQPDEPCGVVDAECDPVATCKTTAIARVVAEALNRLSDEELIAVSGCTAHGAEARDKGGG